MRLYILGKTKDDKGTQLEQLSRTILEKQGFSDITTNVQVGGGSELDVFAKLEQKVGGETIVQKVICECKAHEKPIDINDWLKFIGKLYIERKTTPNTIGLMVALTGAKGTVIGSKEKDFAGDNTVQLIANDGLTKILHELFGLPLPADVEKMVHAITNDQSINYEVNLIYYEREFYWVAEIGTKFILLDRNGTLLPIAKVEQIIDLLPTFTSYNKTQFWDIWKEQDTEFQLYEINRLLTEQLIINKVEKKETLLKELIKNKNGESIPVSPDLFNKVVSDSPLLAEVDDEIRFNEQIDPLEFYGYLVSFMGVTERIVLCDFYQNNINEDFLDTLLPEGIVLSPENRRNCIFMLKHSTAAMLRLLNLAPQFYHAAPLFSNRTPQDPDYHMKLLFENVFMQNITEGFVSDYKNPAYVRGVFKDIKEFDEVCNLRVIENGQEYIINYALNTFKLDVPQIVEGQPTEPINAES